MTLTTTRYTNVNGEVIADNFGGSRRYYVPDPLGSTVAILDATQTQADTFDYFPYGASIPINVTNGSALQFVGTRGYYNENNNLTQVRARFYDLTNSRWLNQDSIWFAGGDFNLYRYVGNNP